MNVASCMAQMRMVIHGGPTSVPLNRMISVWNGQRNLCTVIQSRRWKWIHLVFRKTVINDYTCIIELSLLSATEFCRCSTKQHLHPGRAKKPSEPRFSEFVETATNIHIRLLFVLSSFLLKLINQLKLFRVPLHAWPTVVPNFVSFLQISKYFHEWNGRPSSQRY